MVTAQPGFVMSEKVIDLLKTMRTYRTLAEDMVPMLYVELTEALAFTSSQDERTEIEEAVDGLRRIARLFQIDLDD